jgi:polysaccharide export outer membrane protein
LLGDPEAMTLHPCRRRPGYGLLVLTALVLGLALGLAGPGQAQPRAYQVGPGDLLKVAVFGHEDLTRGLVVSPEGVIPFPLIGDVRVGGLTVGQIEARIREALAKDYLVDPQVAVTVGEYRSQRVFVLGEVEKPATYALTGQTTLVDVLSQAGGPTKSAGRQVLVVRLPRSEGPAAPGSAGSTTLRVNLRRLLDGAGSENVALEGGDTVIVPRLTSFFVQGEVRKPGAYPLDKDVNALEAVTLAGGFTDRAAPNQARVLRRRADGAQESIDLNLTGVDGRARDTLLEEGDTLLVPAGNTFFVLGEVKKPGAYQLEQAATALEGVALAGGFTDKAAPNRTRVIRTHRDGRQETLQVDLNEVLKRGRKDRDIPLSANDVVVVPESFF